MYVGVVSNQSILKKKPEVFKGNFSVRISLLLCDASLLELLMRVNYCTVKIVPGFAKDTFAKTVSASILNKERSGYLPE